MLVRRRLRRLTGAACPPSTLQNVVAHPDDGTVSVPDFIAFLRRFAAGGCPRLSRQRFSDISHAFRKLVFGPLPDFDMFARVFLTLPDTFRVSVLGSVRHHPAHQMSAVLLPTVWSTAHDVAQSECVHAHTRRRRLSMRPLGA